MGGKTLGTKTSAGHKMRRGNFDIKEYIGIPGSVFAGPGRQDQVEDHQCLKRTRKDRDSAGSRIG
jgi:hypothetical protein